MNTTNDKTWSKVVLSVGWQADRHSEHHSIEFQRPTADNPSPQHPVVAGEVLSKSRLPMSDRWGGLYAPIEVEAFDEYSLTIRYGSQQYVIKPADGTFFFGEKGMDYTSFTLHLTLKTEEESPVFSVTHDEKFLRRFRTKPRVMFLSKDDIAELRKYAEKGDPFAEYALGRWLYFTVPTDSAISEAEQLFLSAEKYVPDALAAYAMMWRYGETKENIMDLEESDKLLKAALKQGSERAAQLVARDRIFGTFCDAEPEKVVAEIEQRLSESDDCDPQWHSLLAFAYEQLGRFDDAINQYDVSIAKGQVDDYFYQAFLYHERGNVALHDSLMSKGIVEGSGLCCIFEADMDEEDFKQLSNYEGRQLHERVQANLRIGLKRCEGWCAYYMWYLVYNHQLAFYGDDALWSSYLKRGAQLGSSLCIIKMAELAEEGKWPEPMSDYDIGELWLRAARFAPDDCDALRGLAHVSDETFLLRHKEELEKYWKPRFKGVWGIPQPPSTDPEPEDTGVPDETDKLHEPMVIVIWPSGHMDLPTADVGKMKSYREMAQTLIHAEGLDAVHYSSLLNKVTEAAELQQNLVMYVDRDAQMKNLPDNAIGTQLYGQGEVRGPIIVCLQDERRDPQSFTTIHDLVGTYHEINNHCGGLLIIKDEDDGRYDAYV